MACLDFLKDQMNSLFVVFFLGLLTLPAQAAPASQPVQPAPDLDITVSYYSKVITPEGVTREARYDEKMLRRPGHVWVERILPKNAPDQHDEPAAALDAQGKKKITKTVTENEHRHFNHVVVPRHVILENKTLRIEYVDSHSKDIIAIPPAEYANVNFDGSWENTFYLIDPKLVKTMPRSAKASALAGTQWHEREKNGVFQRILWDEKKQIPLVIESGDMAATFYRRVEVKPLTGTSREVPWQNLKGYAQKEYSDFLD
jgi:hypothetical protein